MYKEVLPLNRMIPVSVDYAKAGVPAPADPATLNLMILPHQEDITLHPERPMVIVVPGGAYAFCSNREAEAIALKFLAEGIHAAVLRYSVAPNRFPAAALELAWSIRYCRAHAEEWHVRPDAISILGFSAGGHLAACGATMSVDKETRPDLQILMYPVITMEKELTNDLSRDALLGREPSQELVDRFSCEKHVTEDTPPAFIVLCSDDTAVPVQNSLMYYDQLVRHKVSATMHIFPYGGHGWGWQDSMIFKESWVSDMEDWLRLIVEKL